MRKSLLLALFWMSMSIHASETIKVKSSPTKTAVVELYTSEGCNSCPPADKWLAQMIKVPSNELDATGVAFHVDYWDYLGWKDEFASPQYTQRQRRLGRLNRQSTIYTPEFFVNGKEARGTKNILQKIRQSNSQPSVVDLELNVLPDTNHYRINLISNIKQPGNYQFQYMVIEDRISTQVKAGENAGKELHHANVVRFLSPMQSLQNQHDLSLAIEPKWNTANQSIAVMVKTVNNEYVQSVSTLPLRDYR